MTPYYSTVSLRTALNNRLKLGIRRPDGYTSPEEEKVPSNRKFTSSTILLVLGMMGLLVGTQLTLIYDNNLGIYFNILTLLVLILVALFRDNLRQLAISLAILPVVQIVCSTILTKTTFRTASIFYGLLLLLALTYRYMFTLDEPVEATQLKVKGHAFGIPLMLVLGESLGAIGYGFLRHHYPYLHVSLPLLALASVVFAFAEEMFLRGLVQQQAARVVHPILAAVITCLLYVSLEISHATPLTVGPAIAMGVVLSAVYHIKHNLLLSTTINAAAKLTYIGLVATFILR